MNLIEQLGGYERTANLIKSVPEGANFLEMYPLGPRFYVSDIGCNRAINIHELRKELLDHRRAHNIFEEGDYIVHDGELKVFAMWSNAIDGCAYIGYAYAEDGEMAHKDEFRHATDEEIKAGHGL